MSAPKTELLYVNSRNRISGTPWDFVVKLPNHMLCMVGRPGRIRVSVIDAIINRCWYSVQDNNNTFSISDGTHTTTYDIPVGYHTSKTIRSVLTALLPTWTVSWDKYTDLCVFTPPDDGKTYTMTFLDAVCELFGFNLISDAPSGTHAAPIVSAHPIKVNRENAVLIHTDIPRIENAVVDNILQPTFCESDILIKIPIDVAPFANLIYTANSNELFSFFTSASNLNDMRIYLTDEYGRSLQVAYDWTLTLKADYLYDEPPGRSIQDNLSRITDYLKLMILSNARSGAHSRN
jgi:hypothetical protein